MDTHAFLWWVTDDLRLSERARSIVEDVRNDVYFSAVSAFEIAIKAQIGRLAFRESPELFVTRQLATNNFRQLPITVRHGLNVFSLPPIHRDPFDRLLVAQALGEDLVLLSDDHFIAQYDVPVTW
ncbi:MAG TPA: type II toxin-antitoxin system VapC family toxin [Nitrolancea sp.]|nr:type II toxin-antitoxin system VapC family toxin [Nitrolancea sp.]